MSTLSASPTSSRMPAPQTVRVSLTQSADRSYDVIVGASALSEAGQLITERLGQRRIAIITDHTVAGPYQQRLEAVLTAAGHDLLTTIIVPPGEGSKDFATLQHVLNRLLECGADRATLVLALGGGMVGDLSGLAASLLMRGVDIVQMPTTLLAQVDSSVGGKTAINSAFGKNTIGAFYQPRLVLADVTTLDSLPARETLAGYAEIVKYGLIFDKAFFHWCEAHGGQLLNGDREAQIYAVSQSCAFKARVVAADERESGDRALLNFGHTFGHALETVTGYNATLLHGEAVAIGMALAFRLSADLGYCPRADEQAVLAHLKAIGLPTTPPPFAYDIDRLMELMAQDKKAQGGKLTMILTRGIGQAFVTRDVNPSPVRALWKTVIN